MWTTDLFFAAPTYVKTPFLDKAMKAVLKQLMNNDLCFTTEGVQGTPAITLLPDVKDLPRSFKTPKLKSDIGSTQLRESFPKTPNNLDGGVPGLCSNWTPFDCTLYGRVEDVVNFHG